MQSLTQYLTDTGISRRTAFNYIASGTLKAVKVKGKTYILQATEPQKPQTAADAEPALKTINKKQVKAVKAAVVDQLNELLVSCAPDAKAQTVNKVRAIVAHWQAQGLQLNGFSSKSCYRKIESKQVERKTRCDKFAVKNQNLAAKFTAIRDIARDVFFKAANPNLALTCDLILEHARQNDELFEIAAVPKSTLYKQLSLEFKQSGFATLHEFFNHYNKFQNRMPRNTGAFTDDIKFMDYICGDDHKCDVASVWVYDKALRKPVLKKVQIWLWNEPVTMQPVGWLIKFGDFTAKDLIASFSTVVLKHGLPNKAVLIDNGIGRSDEFQDFIKRLTYKYPKFSAAYTPTNKATIERTFGLVKNELDVMQTNFVSPHKEDSRHSTAALSPEAADMWFEDYKKKLEGYLTGFFVNRERERVIDGVTKRISIKNYFDMCYRTYEPNPVSGKDVRLAFSEKVIKEYNYGIKYGKETYQPTEPLPISFNYQKFTVLINPFDKSAIDLYAFNDLLDRQTGLFYNKGQFVATLNSVRLMKDKQAFVFEMQKKLKKEIRQMASTVTATKCAIDDLLPDKITNDGKISQEMKEMEKHYQAQIEGAIDRLPASMQLTEDEENGSENNLVSVSIEDSEDSELTYDEN